MPFLSSFYGAKVELKTDKGNGRGSGNAKVRSEDEEATVGKVRLSNSRYRHKFSTKENNRSIAKRKDKRLCELKKGNGTLHGLV